MSGTRLKARLKAWALSLRRDATALWLAARDPRVPWTAKALCALAAGYALSPIDLIPDFIPILGLLDELVLLPLALWAAARLIPPAVMSDLRAQAALRTDKPVSRAAAVFIVVLWILLAVLAAWVVAFRLELGA